LSGADNEMKSRKVGAGKGNRTPLASLEG
jgi:hypothetical protein